MTKVRIKLTAEWDHEVEDDILAESICERLMIEDPNYQPNDDELASELEVWKDEAKQQIAEDPWNLVPDHVEIKVEISS